MNPYCGNFFTSTHATIQAKCLLHACWWLLFGLSQSGHRSVTPPPPPKRKRVTTWLLETLYKVFYDILHYVIGQNNSFSRPPPPGQSAKTKMRNGHHISQIVIINGIFCHGRCRHDETPRHAQSIYSNKLANSSILLGELFSWHPQQGEKFGILRWTLMLSQWISNSSQKQKKNIDVFRLCTRSGPTIQPTPAAPVQYGWTFVRWGRTRRRSKHLLNYVPSC